jgi:hypothetical protein
MAIPGLAAVGELPEIALLPLAPMERKALDYYNPGRSDGASRRRSAVKPAVKELSSARKGLPSCDA